MTKLKSIISVLMLLSFIILSCDNQPKDNSNNNTENPPQNVSFEINDEVQSCFELTNSFRTGSEAWYWNKDNSTKTTCTGLKALTLDEDLCKAAKIRANEIVSNFSHTRPNGSSCFTVLSDLSISYKGVGENIAAGNRTVSGTFTQWKKENENYSGQGHRRNMLGDYTKIGIAYTYDESSTYKYYWVMILTK